MNDAEKVAHATEYAFWPENAVPYNVNFEHFKVLVRYVNNDWAKDNGQWILTNGGAYWHEDHWEWSSSQKTYFQSLDDAIEVALEEVEKIRLFDRSANEYREKLTEEGYLK